MNNIIDAVDLGHFKAYRATKEPMESAKITLVKSYGSIEKHGKIPKKLNDKTELLGHFA
jgi:hypothetical protein